MSADEVLMPLVRVTEMRDGAVFATESAGTAWVPIEQATVGRQWGDDPMLRLGTPDEFKVRRVAR